MVARGGDGFGPVSWNADERPPRARRRFRRSRRADPSADPVLLLLSGTKRSFRRRVEPRLLCPPRASEALVISSLPPLESPQQTFSNSDIAQAAFTPEPSQPTALPPQAFQISDPALAGAITGGRTTSCRYARADSQARVEMPQLSAGKLYRWIWPAHAADDRGRQSAGGVTSARRRRPMLSIKRRKCCGCPACGPA